MALVFLLIFFITFLLSKDSVFRLISTNFGLNPAFKIETISDTQFSGETITSPHWDKNF